MACSWREQLRLASSECRQGSTKFTARDDHLAHQLFATTRPISPCVLSIPAHAENKALHYDEEFPPAQADI
jgi:hypothetical protein